MVADPADLAGPAVVNTASPLVVFKRAIRALSVANALPLPELSVQVASTFPALGELAAPFDAPVRLPRVTNAFA